MKLCTQCKKTPWPFVMVLLIASVAAFATWLTLSLSVTDANTRLLASFAAFIAVGGTLLHYVISCMRRHCRHNREHTHCGPALASDGSSKG